MKKLLLGLLLIPAVFGLDPLLLRDGDFILQDLPTTFGDSVSQTTKSSYAHVGIIDFVDGTALVIEATTPRVTLTSLSRFVRNSGSVVAVVRPLGLSQAQVQAMKTRARSHVGKPYDRLFNLTETDKIYCSELVYDALSAGAQDFRIKPSPMDFSAAWEYWEKWFLGHKIPQGEPGVSPDDIFTMGGEVILIQSVKPAQGQYLWQNLYQTNR